MEVFEAHDGGITQRKIARTHGVSPATVERWYHSHCQLRRSELSNRPCPQVLGIDEHFFNRRRGYATSLVDLKNHKVFDVTLGRPERSLRAYLRRLPQHDQVRVVVMDLSETYRSIARRFFPQATIVADRFHAIRLVNQHFLKVWQQHDPEGRKNRGLLNLMRRHAWHLSYEQQDNLQSYLSDFPVLTALYEAKQRLNRFLLLEDAEREESQPVQRTFLQLLEQLEESPLHRLARTLTSWLEPIIAMWRFSRSNGITVGLHTKMEMMTRRAYGFRNFENYQLQVFTRCGWDGISNLRVPRSLPQWRCDSLTLCHPMLNKSIG